MNRLNYQSNQQDHPHNKFADFRKHKKVINAERNLNEFEIELKFQYSDSGLYEILTSQCWFY